MQFIPPLLFGISASLDALLVGMTFGIRGTQIKIRQNLLISLITLIGTCFSVGLGSQLTALLHASLWQDVGSLILILMGIYYITKSMIQILKKYHLEKPLTATQTASAMTFTQACSLGCALSANNMGIGLSASIGGLTLIPAAIVTLFFSFIFLFVGNRFGQLYTFQLKEPTTNLITGILLIGLGLLSYK